MITGCTSNYLGADGVSEVDRTDEQRTNKSIKEFQAEFEKLYKELQKSLDCADLDVHIHQYSSDIVVVNLDIR